MNSRHSVVWISAQDARIHIHKLVSFRQLDISQQVQWKDAEEQQLNDFDEHQYKEIDLVIYLTRSLRESIHAYR